MRNFTCRRPHSVGRIPFPTQSSFNLKGCHVDLTDNSTNVGEKVEDLTYLKENVDPIISPAIIHVLKEVATPDQIPLLFLNYFHRQLHTSKACKSYVSNASTVVKTLKRRHRSCVNTMKVSLALASFLSKVLQLTLRARPEINLNEFLYKIVQRMQHENIILTPQKRDDVVKTENNPDINNVTNGTTIAQQPMTLIFLVAGLSKSGKTTLVSVLKGSSNPRCKPSLGFLPVSLKYNENITVKMYDVGGGEKIRGIWNNYYHEVHGVIYIVDSACTEAVFQETMSVATETLGHKYIQGKPLLVMSNKIDEPESRPIDYIRQELNIIEYEQNFRRIAATSIHPHKSKFEGRPDPKIDESLKWLIETTLVHITDLNERIREDTEKIKLFRIKKHEEKEHRILTNSIAKAFPTNSEECTDVLQKDEAEEFLSHEIGLSGPILLPPEGKQICELVGFQRFALMIIASKIHPKPGHRAWSWEDISSHVQSIRSELRIE